MTIKDEIIAIANQLANDGITPSVAKVKAKLSETAPLPTIINTLKNWQHQPEKTTVDNNAESVKARPVENELEAAISKAIKPLIDEIKELKQQLTALERKLDNK